MINKDQNQISLIEETVNAFDGGISTLEPQDGLTLIDKWLDRLDEVGDDATDEVADTLEELRVELDTLARDGRPDVHRLTDLLQSLMDQTQKIAQTPEASAEQVELSQLIATLESLHRQIASYADQPNS